MAGGFSVTISAVDGATASIDKINKKLAGMMAPVERLNKSLSKFGDVSGLNKMIAGFTSLGRGALDVARKLISVVGPLSAITSAASIAGLMRLVDVWGEFGQRLGFDATRIGIASDKLQSLQGSARLAGGSANAATSGLRTLSDTLTDAVGGRNAEAVVMFRTLGIEFRNLDGSARTAESVLPEIANRIAALKNPTLQARVATQLLGAAGEELLPWLRKGAAGMAEYEAQARRYGVTNEAGVRGANMLREAQARLGLAVDGLGNSIAQTLAPVLVPLLDRLSNWIAAHRTDIAAAIERIAKAFSAWVDGGGLGRLGESLSHIATGIDTAIEKFGGWGLAAEVLGGLLALNVVAKLVRITGLIGALRLPIWLATLLGVGLTTAVTLPLALRGDTDPNATPEGVAPGFVPDNTGERHNFTNDVIDPIRRHLPTWLGGTPTPPPPDQLAAGRGIHTQLMGLGWTAEQAAGVVANLQRESSFNPSEVGDGGQAYGLGQWHPDRQANFARQFGHPIQGSTTEEQVRFIDWELRNTESAAGDRLRRSTLPGEAGDVVSQYYERPGDRYGEAQRRASAARHWMPAGAPVAGPYAPAAGTAGAPGAAGTVKVDVTLKNAPAGTNANVSTSGNVSAGARVERSMPYGAS